MRNFAVHIDGSPGAILPVSAVPPGLSFVRMQELVWLLEQGYGGLELGYMQGLLHQSVTIFHIDNFDNGTGTELTMSVKRSCGSGGC